MCALPALPSEKLVDYFVRVLDASRRTNAPIQCGYKGQVFIATPDMTTNDIVRVWFDAGPQRIRLSA